MTNVTYVSLSRVNRTTVSQIRKMDLLATSGGRVVERDENTIDLPVAHGYSVRVEYLAGRDVYRVTRVFTRGSKSWVKRTWDDVYFDMLSDVVYTAGCWRDDD